MTDHSDDAAAMRLSQLRVSRATHPGRAGSRSLWRHDGQASGAGRKIHPPDRLIGVVLQPSAGRRIGLIYLLGVVYDVICLHTRTLRLLLLGGLVFA